MTFRRISVSAAEMALPKSAVADHHCNEEVRQLRAALHLQESDAHALMAEVRELQDKFQAQAAQMRELELHARSLEAQLGNRDQALHALVNSFSWRCTASLRQGPRQSQKFASSCKTAALASYRFAPWPWHVLFRIAPGVFQNTSSYQSWHRARNQSRTGTADAASTASPTLLQDQTLGVDLSLDPAMPIAVGIATGDETDEQVRRMIGSARRSLNRAGLSRNARIYALTNRRHARADLSDIAVTVSGERQTAHAAAHNRLMTEAFADGASIYIASAANGSFHPAAIPSLVRMMQAHPDGALIEAVQFPSEAPRTYDPQTFETAWVSSACLAIPRAIGERLGGFDEHLDGRCADVDYSWRARAHGFGLYTCPTARFFRAPVDEADEKRPAELVRSAISLAQKWGNVDFASELELELKAEGLEAPDVDLATVPHDWRRFADFSHGLEFSETRW